MICSIHQPNYIPYLGLFHKINQSDIFVFYDNAQYTKGDYHNRNTIKTANWESLLTIPVQVSLWDKINEVKLNKKAVLKHLKTIDQSYKKAEYYSDVFPFLKELFEYETDNLASFNENFIVKVCEYIWINTKFIKLSEILPNLETSSTEALVEICKAVNATEYISWSWWKNYIESDKFENNWIKLNFQDFNHPEYKQLWWDFKPYMSIIDLLLNEWKNSINYLK